MTSVLVLERILWGKEFVGKEEEKKVGSFLGKEEGKS